MRLLLVTGIFPPDIGGPATYTEKLAFELVRRGHQVVVICYSRSKEVLDYPFSVIRVPFSHNIFIRYAIFFWQTLKLSRNFDLLFAQDPFITGLPCLLINLLTGKKYILKIVGDFSWEYARGCGYAQDQIEEFQARRVYHPLIGLIRCVQKLACRCCHQIIVPSQYLKKIVSRWHVPVYKIKVIYNAVDLSEIKESRQQLRKELNINDGEKIIISAGRLVPWKGFAELVELVADMGRQMPELRLIIIGDGPLNKSLTDKVKVLALESKIKLTGTLKRELFLKYLKAADVFVLNSFYEGLSHVILEAMAIGTPIIATAIGGNAEVIKNDVNGRLVVAEDKNELKKTLLDLLRIDTGSLVVKAQADVQQFSWDNHLRNLLEVINFKPPEIFLKKLIGGKILRDFFPIAAEERVLNLGAGYGPQALVYEGIFREMVGIDINEKRIETSKNLMNYYGIKNYFPICADVEKVPLPDASFEKVIAVDIVEHVQNPSLMVQEARRLLKENGQLLITFPALHDFFTDNIHKLRIFLSFKNCSCNLHNLSPGWNPDEHQLKESVTDWIKLIETQGFKMIRSRATTMFPPLHLYGLPKFWFTNRLINKIDSYFCAKPQLQKFGQTIMAVFEQL